MESELDMTYSTILNKSRVQLSSLLQRAGYWGAQRPLLAMALLVGTGTALGAGVTLADNAILRSKADRQEALIAATEADEVMVVERGKIVQRGIPTDLLAADGPFRRLAGSRDLAGRTARDAGRRRPPAVRARPCS